MEMEEVVEKATKFVQTSGYLTYKMMAVKFDKSKNEWSVKFDVGAIRVIYVTVIIDDATGRIIGYERT